MARMTIKVDNTQVTPILAKVADAVAFMSDSYRERFLSEKHLLESAGAVWVECDFRDGAVHTRFTHDFRMLCAKFGVWI